MTTRFIGDVHGKFTPYKKIIETADKSIQVGDMGVGFVNPITNTIRPGAPFDAMSRGDHRFIRGNHDNPEVCKTHPYWIADGTMKDNVFCVGGAFSIDRAWRTEFIDWWANEELSYSEWMKVFDIYENIKPEIVCTHDAPRDLVLNVLGPFNRIKVDKPSSTVNALQTMLEIHAPKLWITGHWHIDVDINWNGMRYICVGELSYIDIDLTDVSTGTIVPRISS